MLATIDATLQAVIYLIGLVLAGVGAVLSLAARAHAMACLCGAVAAILLVATLVQFDAA